MVVRAVWVSAATFQYTAQLIRQHGACPYGLVALWSCSTSVLRYSSLCCTPACRSSMRTTVLEYGVASLRRHMARSCVLGVSSCCNWQKNHQFQLGSSIDHAPQALFTILNVTQSRSSTPQTRSPIDESILDLFIHSCRCHGRSQIIR